MNVKWLLLSSLLTIPTDIYTSEEGDCNTTQTAIVFIGGLAVGLGIANIPWLIWNKYFRTKPEHHYLARLTQVLVQLLVQQNQDQRTVLAGLEQRLGDHINRATGGAPPVYAESVIMEIQPLPRSATTTVSFNLSENPPDRQQSQTPEVRPPTPHSHHTPRASVAMHDVDDLFLPAFPEPPALNIVTSSSQRSPSASHHSGEE